MFNAYLHTLALLLSLTLVAPIGSFAQSDTAKPEGAAATLDGPHTLYVRNGDIDKGLAIKPGSPLYIAPDNAAAVLTYAEEGDAITITGLHGRWTQIELQKKLSAPAATTEATPARDTTDLHAESASLAETPAVTASAEAAVVEIPEAQEHSSDPEPHAALEVLAESETGEPERLAVVDEDPSAQTATVAITETAPAVSRRPQQAQAEAAAASAYKPALNRSQLQGKLVSTRRRFAARRAYDWQLNAKFSFRVAYLDFSRMQGTDQLDRYAGQQVVVYGLVSPLGDGQYVMEVESIRLQ